MRSLSFVGTVLAVAAALGACSSDEDDGAKASFVPGGSAGSGASSGRGGAASGGRASGGTTSAGGRGGAASSGGSGAVGGENDGGDAGADGGAGTAGGGRAGAGNSGAAGSGGTGSTGGAAAGSGSGGAPSTGGTATGGTGAGGSGGTSGAAMGGNANVAWPLEVSSNGRYLVDQEGEPLLLHGDTPWELIPALAPEDVVRYLDDRASRRVRALIVELVVSPAFRATNYAGEKAFTGTLGGGAVDLATPNDAYFDHADYVLRQALDRDIAVLLFPLYLGYQGGNEGFYADMVANGAAKVRGWGEYVGARYGSFGNVVWVLAGDYLPNQSGLTLIGELAAGIKATEGQAHVMSAHWGPDQSSHESPQPWLDVNYAYAYEPNDPYEEVTAGYGFAGGPMPVFLGESRYEKHATNPSRAQIRRQAYGAMLAGACGQFLGNEVLWRFATNWQAELDSAGSQDMQRLAALFDGRPWHELVPDTASTLVTGGRGSAGSTTYVTAGKTPDGRLGLAYLPGGTSVTVALGALEGTAIRARWFDPANGTYIEIADYPASGSQSFTPTGNNSEGASDWVLVLEATP